MAAKAALLVGLLYIGLCSVESARILMVPGPHNSHANFFSKAGKSLQDAGHEVYVLTIGSLGSIVDKAGLKKLVHVAPPEEDVMVKLAPALQKITKGEDFFPRALLYEFLPLMAQYCKDILSNREIMERIANINFDLVVHDGVMFYTCLYSISYRFDIKFITLSAMYVPWSFGVPALPSVEPSQLIPFTNQMSFMQRAINVLPYMILTINPVSYYYSKEIMDEFLPDKPFKTFNQLMAESKVTLVNNDVICNGYPRISSPSYHFIGGASASPAKPLPDDLQKFADGAKDGLIVLSFGSLKALHSLWPAIKPKFMGSFKRLSQRAIVQYASDDVSGVPDNVKLVKWLPQNDLLGHPNTRLFITHGGSNGQLEAVYHGVPLLTMPFTGDQDMNAAQAKSRGFGLTLARLTMTEEDIYSSIREMIDNPKYRNNVRRCSAIQKTMPSSQEAFLFWVNHVLEFGGDHLRSPAADMPLYQVFMLDVLLFFVFVFILSCTIFVLCCRFLITKCCSSKKQKRE